ncbi:MAG: hypothetical protein KC416_17125, partial [Myxococcales bacterium]|nr:hypothetical protein [Myxococcales bacterium]
MPSRTRLLMSFALAALSATLGACNKDPEIPAPVDGGTGTDEFICETRDSKACIGGVHHRCEPIGEVGLKVVTEDCDLENLLCVVEGGCLVCSPKGQGCDPDGNVATCNDDGSAWIVDKECPPEDGLVCHKGRCVDPCEVADDLRSYVGCEFFTADLDNASLDSGADASAQQYAVVVSNPNPVAAEVVVEINEGAPGAAPKVKELMRVQVGPGDLEVFELPRREVDGSSSNEQCLGPEDTCPVGEQCFCSGPMDNPFCTCRLSMATDGKNDGTHSALTAQAFRVTSNWPIVAYQFNPLENVGVFSNDASLLLPTSALGTAYTVVSWPQTIAN